MKYDGYRIVVAVGSGKRMPRGDPVSTGLVVFSTVLISRAWSTGKRGSGHAAIRSLYRHVPQRQAYCVYIRSCRADSRRLCLLVSCKVEHGESSLKSIQTPGMSIPKGQRNFAVISSGFRRLPPRRCKLSNKPLRPFVPAPRLACGSAPVTEGSSRSSSTPWARPPGLPSAPVSWNHWGRRRRVFKPDKVDVAEPSLRHSTWENPDTWLPSFMIDAT